MTISLTGTGGLFTRLGKLTALLKAVNLFRGTGAIPVSLSGSGATVTATSQFAHGYTTGDTVVIAGSTSANFNGTYTITVTGTTTFTYAATGTGTAAGTITATKTGGVGFFAVGPYVDNLFAQFQAADQNLTTSLYATRDTYRGVHTTLTNTLKSLASSILVQMANEDTPLASPTASNALKLLISQMLANNQTVLQPTVSLLISTGSGNVGGGGVVASFVEPTRGVQQDYLFPEKITLTCTTDSQSGGVAAQEVFTVTSPAAESDPLNWDFPLGSGISTSLRAVDALQNNAGGNKLTNSSWQTFTVANTPDNWPIQTGTPGTTIFKATGGNVYRGTSGLNFLGNGSELTEIYQPFGVSSNGTPGTLAPATVYCGIIWLKADSGATGTLRLALTDGNLTVLNDASGLTPNSLSVNVASLTTAFGGLGIVFRTPLVNPASGYRFDIKMTTALNNGKNLYLSNLALTPATQLYPGGPYAAVFAGNPNFINADNFTITITNKLDSQWQFWFDRLFGMRGLGLQLPSGNSPTIAESLIA